MLISKYYLYLIRLTAAIGICYEALNISGYFTFLKHTLEITFMTTNKTVLGYCVYVCVCTRVRTHLIYVHTNFNSICDYSKLHVQLRLDHLF